MTSQISQIYTAKPLREPRSRGRTALGAVAGVLTIGTAAAWLFNRLREQPLASRTRARLAPRPTADLADIPVVVVPNAADIRVS